MSTPATTFYVTGGTLRPDAPSYVERQADKDLLDGLLKGEFCYVLTSRQMGKSSLMVRTTRKLREQKRNVAILDLTALGQNLTPEQWYDGLITKLAQPLDLEDELLEFWRAHSQWGPLQRWMMALERIVLPKSAASLVIFIDEIDVVRSLPFITDEFFAAIRECYNRRTHDPQFHRVTFCLLGVASPSDLIRDPRVTPFNIGRRIELNDFTLQEATPLAQGLALRLESEPPSTPRLSDQLPRQNDPLSAAGPAASSDNPINPQHLLNRILYWTNGHPYLTQRLCRTLAERLSLCPPPNPAPANAPSPAAPLPLAPALVDDLCEELFLSPRARERDDNLLYVRERMLRTEVDLQKLLQLYRDIRGGTMIRDDDSNDLINPLRLAGIIRVEQGALRIRNAIYEHVFDGEWIQAHMPSRGDEGAKVERFQNRHQVGLLTLVCTQVADPTQLSQDLGEERGAALLQRQHAIHRELLRQFTEAEEMQSNAAGAFLVFSKPADAVRFSLALQSQLRVLAQATSDSVRARIGIHLGEMAREEGLEASESQEHYGMQVELCSRLMTLAERNQILLTRSAFDHARQALKRQDADDAKTLSWVNHGLYQLSDFEDPIEVCEVGEKAWAQLQPPRDSATAKRRSAAESESVLGWRPACGEFIPRTTWLLEAKLGEGGFGEVWLGHEKSNPNQRRVFKFCFRADRARSLKREATLFRLLRERVGAHPHIVGVHDYFLDRPPYYLTMDYVPGRDLRSWWEAMGGPKNIPLETRLEIVAQVAQALHAAHQAGVIHRDIKPSNILVESQGPTAKDIHVKLTDFGIGQVVSKEVLSGLKALGFTQTMMSPGSSVQAGTYIYMAPELLAGMPAVPQSDLYSLGIVLYQLIVGDLSRPVTMDWLVEDPLLREDLARCFSSDPRERFASGDHLAYNLRHLKNRRTSAAKHAVELASRETAAARRKRVRKIAIVLFWAAAASLVAYVVWKI